MKYRSKREQQITIQEKVQKKQALDLPQEEEDEDEEQECN